MNDIRRTDPIPQSLESAWNLQAKPDEIWFIDTSTVFPTSIAKCKVSDNHEECMFVTKAKEYVVTFVLTFPGGRVKGDMVLEIAPFLMNKVLRLINEKK